MLPKFADSGFSVGDIVSAVWYDGVTGAIVGCIGQIDRIQRYNPMTGEEDARIWVDDVRFRSLPDGDLLDTTDGPVVHEIRSPDVIDMRVLDGPAMSSREIAEALG